MAPRGTRKAVLQRQTAPAPTGAPRTASDPEPLPESFLEGLKDVPPDMRARFTEGSFAEPEEVMLEPPRIAEPFTYPAGWRRGQYLNVRALSDAVYITDLSMEYDYSQPDKGLRFEDRGKAQDFISWWYLRDYAPR